MDVAVRFARACIVGFAVGRGEVGSAFLAGGVHPIRRKMIRVNETEVIFILRTVLPRKCLNSKIIISFTRTDLTWGTCIAGKVTSSREREMWQPQYPTLAD